jgi:hypothetical protein
MPPLQLPADLLSVSQIARELSLAVPAVVQLAAAAGVSAVFTVDGLPYYDANDFDRLSQQLQHNTLQFQIAAQN